MGAKELLEDAKNAAKSGDNNIAIDLYTRVIDEAPGSQEAETAKAARYNLTASNKPVSNSVSNVRNDYSAGIGVANFVSAAGWLICVAVPIIVVFGAASSRHTGGLLADPTTWPIIIGAIVGGLMLVVSGQAARAVFDTANNSRQILEEIRRGKNG